MIQDWNTPVDRFCFFNSVITSLSHVNSKKLLSVECSTPVSSLRLVYLSICTSFVLPECLVPLPQRILYSCIPHFPNVLEIQPPDDFPSLNKLLSQTVRTNESKSAKAKLFLFVQSKLSISWLPQKPSKRFKIKNPIIQKAHRWCRSNFLPLEDDSLIPFVCKSNWKYLK